MAGARAAQRRIAPLTGKLMVKRIGAHDLGPLGPFGVGDLHGDRRAQRTPMAHTGKQPHLVLFELHACSTPVAETTASQGTHHVIAYDLDAGGQALDHRHQCLAMRLACRLPTQHTFPFHSQITGLMLRHGIPVLLAEFAMWARNRH